MTKPMLTNQAFKDKAREVIAEGCVLLRNENRALPLEKGCRVALFGRTQMNYFKSGLGSGGLVNTRYVTGIYEALSAEADIRLDGEIRQAYVDYVAEHPFDVGDGWAHHPWYQQEMPLADGLVSAAAQRNDAAVVIIGRTAGEDRDNADEPGSWRLTGEEEAMLESVCRHFERTIVLLNVGNIIDMGWVEKFQPAAVLYVWQGGQEGGLGVADVLCGRVAPCGRLTDTIAAISDYPAYEGFGDAHRSVYAEDIYVGYRYFESFAKEKVLYPFGFGLSYTTFLHEPVSFAWDGEKAILRTRVTNTGDAAAKEVVQVYVEQLQGKLGKPSRVLCGFAKTEVLRPGDAVEVEITIPAARLASYDDGGVTGCRSCYVLEAGEYAFYAGHDVRCTEKAGTFVQAELRALEQLEEACAPVESFQRLHPVDGCIAWEDAPTRQIDPVQRRMARLPEEIAPAEYAGLKLADVASGRCTMEQFIAQMTDDDLCCIVRGEGMSSPRVTPGTASAFGGVTDRLTGLFGLPAACCADGPSGIRMDCGNIAFSMPNGTLQACTWNEKLVEELYVLEGLEMRKYQVDSLLGPGMNIHRHPLNGRNFEYFSEDPLVTGLMASAQLKGMHQSGVTGTIKHYACNNQESYRRQVNAVVSERALREIYLKGYEIAVKEGGARSIMTAYNPLNGWWTASHYDLNTTILRGEWGYTGIVMTDWWAAGSEDQGESSVSKVASMVRAQNDLFMVTNNPAANSGNDDSAESLANGTVTRAEYQRSAMNICRFLLDTPAFRRLTGQTSPEDEQLQQLRDEDGDVILHIPEVEVGKEAVIPGDALNTASGQNNLFQMKLDKRGQYRIDVICRASAALPDTAQLPISVSVDRMHLGAQVITGGDKEWQTLSFTTHEVRRRLIFYIKFFFAVGGMEVKEIRIIRTQVFE
ncbi:MAG: glycoside hydrolase family 3 protein [Clostridia bacterium]|nr:glycoside hydrolase family 3 protein [Clostridia bacterium]